MKRPSIKAILLVPVALFAALYGFVAVKFALQDDLPAVFTGIRSEHETVALFGASGTAGDGILKAAMNDPEIDTIHVFTRRETERIKSGVATGKVVMTKHMDYLDYSNILDTIAEVDAVYWAIGTSTFGVDEQTYSRIHVDFPVAFVRQWNSIGPQQDASFHYISSSDISEDSRMMWAREKMRAERELFALARGTSIRVIAYRPDYIGPTQEEANLGQNLLYWFFAPVKSAVKAVQIGQAMLEVTSRLGQFENGDRLSTRAIIRQSEAYESRQSNEQG